MKIVISRLTKELGGAELSAIDHATVLRNLGHKVVVITNFPLLCKLVQKKNIKTHKLSWIHPKSFRPLLFPALFAINLVRAFFILLATRPSIVNPHSRDDQITLTLLRPLFGYRVVWKDAGDMHFQLKETRTNLPARLYQNLYEYCIGKCDGVYFLNTNSETEAVNQVPELHGKTKVIKSDMLFDNFTIGEKMPRKNVVIGTAIRLVEDKGVDQLIDAFAGVHSKLPETELWIVGDGVFRSKLEDQATQLGLGKSVQFMGYQSDPSYWYSNFDIFVQPALYEPWGRNVKEAKYFGLPILGSATDGISKQINDGKNGILYKTGDVKDLEKKLTKLVRDVKLRQSLGKKAKQSALKEGDFNNLIRDEILPFLEGK